MRARISSAALQRIRAEAAASPHEECCGLLFGHTLEITRSSACINVAADRSRSFEIDPVALVAAHRAMRGGGPRLIGHYHSHPNGVATPSPRDAAAAAPDGMIWLIVAGVEVTAWRAVEHGAVAGRFDALRLDIMTSACANGAASSQEAQITPFRGESSR